MVQNNMSTAVIWSKSKPDVEFQYGGRLGEFHGMSSQSHVSHCRVLPLGEFTVMIPEPHATLQGVIIPSAILKIVFRHILFYFCFFKGSSGFDERRLSYRLRYTCIGIGKYLGCMCQDFPLGGIQGAQGQEPDLHRLFAFQWDIWRSYGRISMKFYASKITEKRVHGFAWNVACQQMSERGRSD